MSLYLLREWKKTGAVHNATPFLLSLRSVRSPLSEKAAIIRVLDEWEVLTAVWFEVADFLPDIERLHEQKEFSERGRAALLAAKVTYCLTDYKGALRFVLAAQEEFDLTPRECSAMIGPQDEQFVNKMIEEALDSYKTAKRQQGEMVDDCRLEALINRIFDRNMQKREYRHVVGLALDTRRTDMVEKAIKAADDQAAALLAETVVKVLEEETLAEERLYRGVVLDVLMRLFSELKEPDYVSMCQCLIKLGKASEIADLLYHLFRHSNGQLAAKQQRLAVPHCWPLKKDDVLLLTVEETPLTTSPIVVIGCERAGSEWSRWQLMLDMSNSDDIGLFFGCCEKENSAAEGKQLIDLWAVVSVALGYNSAFDTASGEPCPCRRRLGSRGWADFIQRRDLFQRCHKDEQLVIVASMAVYRRHFAHLQYLAETVAALFDEQLLGDFTVRCHDGRDIRVPKKLLARKSPLFVQETTKTDVLLVVDDFDCDTVQAIISFFYSGQLLLDDRNVAELLAAANKYEIARLKQLCIDRLTAQLTLANACQMLVLGEVHNGAQLKQAAMDAICADLPAAMGTEGWKKYLIGEASNCKSALLNEVIRAMGERKQQGGVERNAFRRIGWLQPFPWRFP